MNPIQQKTLFPLLIGVGIFPFMINGYINSLIADMPILYWGFELFSWVVLPTFIFGIAIKYGGLDFNSLGLNGKIFGKRNLPLLIIVCIILCPLDYWLYHEIYNYFRAVFPSTPVFSYQSVIPSVGLWSIVIPIYFSLSAGIVEELYFRGFMLKTSSLFAYPMLSYLILSPLLFSLAHWEGGVANMLATYIFGVLAALAFLWLKNLWPLIIAHVYTDFMWFS